MNDAKDRDHQEYVQARFMVKRSYGYSPISPKRTNDKVKLLSVNDGAENSQSPLRSGTGFFHMNKKLQPLLKPASPERPSFVGDVYAETTEAGFYSMSDLVARNYTLSARGLTLRAADAVLHRNVRVEDALERGVPSQKRAMQLASHTMKRPYNIRDLPREEIYESKSTTRKISNNLGQKPLYPVKQGIRNNSKLYLNPEALLTPRPAPRLYTGNHAIPTGSDWTPIPRISETKTISSDLPLSMTKESYNKQIEESTAKFKKMLHEIQRQKMESKTSLQSLADSTVLKTWLNNAMNMLPSSNNDEILRRMVEELRAEFEEANAMSTAFYSLLDPRFAHEAQIDRTALYPPPSIWHDTRYLSRSWSIDRNTGVSNEKVVTAYHYMERSSFVSQKIMVDAQTLWLSRTSDVNLFTNISSPEFRKTLPLSPSDVENAVRRFATTVRERLLDTWLKDCQELLLHALPVNESADLGTNPEKDDHAKSRQYPEEANALHSKKESPVLNSIEGMQTTYSSFEAQDEMEAWVSSLPSMDEGVTGKKTLLGSRESKTTLSSQLALREVDISENISAQKTKGAQKLMASLATLMGRQLREMVSESLNVVSEFFLQFDNSSLAAKNIEKKRQSAVHAHLAIKSAKLTEAVLHGEGVGTGDGMFDFTPCGDIHRYRRVSRSQIILAALSHLKNIKSSTFNSSLIAVSHKPPESVFTLHMNVKDEEVGIFPTFEELESTVQNIILHIASASTQFPRPDSIAAIKSSEGSHGKLQSKYRLSQVLASSEIQVDPSAGFDEEILEARARIYRSIRGQKAKPLALLKGLKRFEVLFGDEFENKITTAIEGLEDVRSSATLALEGAGGDVTKISDALSNLDDAQSAALKNITRLIRHLDMLSWSATVSGNDMMFFEMFAVDLRPFKSAVRHRIRELQDIAFTTIAEYNFKFMEKLCATYEQIGARLIKEPADAAELKALIDYSEICVNDLDILSEKIKRDLVVRTNFLINNGHKHSKDDLALTVVTLGWPINIMEYRSKSASMQNAEKVRREEILVARKEYFEHELNHLVKEVSSFKSLGDVSIKQVTKYCNKLQQLETSLSEAEEESRVIAEEEGLLEIKETSSENFRNTVATLKSEKEKYANLWFVMQEKQQKMEVWLTAPLHSLNAETVANEADNYRRAMIKAVKLFQGDDCQAPNNAATSLKDEMNKFCKEYSPLMELMCTRGLQKRHWDTMNEVTGLSMKYLPDATLQQAIDYGLHKEIEKIEETCVNASKEFSLEKALDTMEEEWKEMQFVAKPYKDSGTYILSSVDEIQQILDDQIVRSQAMRGSRYVKPFEKRVTTWEKTLNDLQEIIDNWLEMQGTWLYLEPIFSSDDIKKQMPQEAKRFAIVDKTFRESMTECVENPSVITVARTEGLLEKLMKANELLDVIQKGLTNYLETKRVFFPRFFFLSNDELLEILSETKDPLRVQPHLKKCFEGISELEFGKNMDINAMFSAEKEKIEFTYDAIHEKIVNPNDAGGQVEVWLEQIEKIMRKTVAYQNDMAVEDYQKLAVDAGERTKWLVKWPGQVVLSSSQIYWTQDMTSAIENEGGGGVAKYAEQLTKQLSDIVLMVRGKITKLERSTISALVVLDVHARDVSEEIGKLGVDDITDFNWLRELRYYWIPGGQSALSGQPDSILCRQINAERKYAYEYLGNSARLVITPLTDRCYRTLMTAIHLDYGGAPAGPAGTGKTETVKDLGKAIAIQTVVFNCSDTLDYLAMGKFFKGLAGAGCWACFDEFNRITLEVLSVVAQQILTIQMAKIAMVDRFDFEGQNVAIRRTCCAYVTMNPGYAGRQELPDNLKALFRSVAMMVPDYAQIGQIILYSMGYMAGEELARKIVTTYSLCSEQLSKQRHYDYGMRAVVSVLKAAGNLKRKNPDAEELILGLRAIVDVNLPKFLAPDVPLFFGIVGDLFPGITLPKVDNSVMEAAMVSACKDLGVQATDYFLKKTFEIWEMMLIRHGFMIVGLPWAGKTMAYKTLSSALHKLHAEYPDDSKYSNVFTCVLNPKAITMGQLYGQFDPVSHEWSDGIVAINYRKFSSLPSKIGKAEDRRWLIFDGPVDAIWIENMNTVLDDNKKLCLESGEMVPLGPTCSMMFEPMDLEVASPATVSRVGVIYMEPFQIGWRPLVISWLQTLCPKFVENTDTDDIDLEAPPASDDQDKKGENNVGLNVDEEKISNDLALHILMLVDWLADPTICFMNKMCTMVVPAFDQTLINAFLNLCTCLIENYLSACTKSKGKKFKQEDEEMELTKDVAEAIVLFSLIWSVGAVTDTEGRNGFNQFLRSFLDGPGYIDELQSVKTALQLRSWKAPPFPGSADWLKLKIPIPRTGSVYDYNFNPKDHSWIPWTDCLPKTGIAADAQFSNIFVPTIITAQLHELLQLLVTHSKAVLLVGSTGTGKSAFINKLLNKDLPDDKWSSISLAFSANTSANMTQAIVDGKLDKRRKGVFGPALNTKAVIFVDDINMPEVEEYGAQPPIELLRQFCCDKGWYDINDKTFRSIIDTQLICAMGPPGGGSSEITPRFMRHFSTICVTSFNDDTLKLIFSTIMQWHARITKMDSGVSKLIDGIVHATLDTYRTVMRELRPTPMKSHYTFNLRDFARVIQGVCMCKPYEGFSADVFIRLWVHESLRVFSDRLIDIDDQKWFFDTINERAGLHFNRKLDELFMHLYEGEESQANVETARKLLFGNFLDANAAMKQYKEIIDFEKLHASSNQFLEDYNAESKKPMDLVLFMFAIEHATRIARVLAMPGGNMLLVGIGGSGRQSLSRLATFILDYGLKQIELSKNYGKVEWHDDIKSIMKAAGLSSQPQVFLFADTQIKLPSFVEDLNNLLNAGEVPNIFDVTEKIEVVDGVRTHAKNLDGYKNMNSTQLYSYFISRVRANMHIVLAFSPIGDAFRERIRKFPSLVNCCTIDWFFAWPKDALEAVAKKFLSGIKVEAAIRDSIIKACPEIHDSVSAASRKFRNSMKRINYVTPTSYLELIKTFTSQLGKNLDKVAKAKQRYDTGLEKLDFAANSVATMQEELTALLPTLDQAKKDTTVLMEQIEEKLPGVKALEENVSKEAAVVQVEVDKCNVMKEECEADLAEAIPALNSAIAALNTLKKSDIDECKNFKKPPSTVVLVMSGVCDMLGIKPQRIQDPDDSSKKINDYWGPAKNLLGQKDFLSSLQTYDKDNIPVKTITTIRTKYITDPDFTPEKAAKASKAALGLCKWVIAMECYDRVAKVVKPKKEKLAQSEAELDVLLKELNVKKSELKAVQDDLGALEQNLADAEAKKEKLIADVDLTEKKLIRAQQLIEGLGGENDRWTASSKTLGQLLVAVPGDVLLSSGLIAYLGAFTSTFRTNVVSTWISMNSRLTIPCSSKPSLRMTLGDEVLIRDWNIQGLPTDNFSIENGIVVFNASRWPLMIDPEGAANKWIRNLEKDNALKVIKLTNADYMRTVENAVQFGSPVLLENVGEHLDPTLEPLLLKQTFKQGGVLQIQLGENAIEYSEHFRFYITTKLPNPHYLPETAVRVSLLNFMITPEGLKDQLLAKVVREEKPDLADLKERLIIEGAENARSLKDVEDKILHILSSSEGNILEDEGAINALNSSKVISDDIKVKQTKAEKAEAEIDEVRMEYVPVAENGQLLYFCISSLANIEPTYQYALDWFGNLFIQGIRKSENSSDLQKRIKNLNDYFTYSLYCNICRSLLEKDKLLFSFLLTASIMEGKGEIPFNEWYFLLTGGVASENPNTNPAPTWLSNQSWGQFCRLDDLSAFEGIRESLEKCPDAWQVIYDTDDAHRAPLPQGWDDRLNKFQKMLILRCIRQDKIALSVIDYVSETMGEKYVSPPTFNLKACYDDSICTSPLIFVLSAGSDPMSNISKFATVMKKTFESISLGQGQGPKAQKIMERGHKEGFWAVLQNCHLCPSWMPTLEKICENVTEENTHRDYRLWCTTYPSDDFPVAILQNGIKMTIEPPKGLRQNILSVYRNDPICDPEFFDSCSKGRDFRKLLFALCFFHANVQERREYGALGWNNPYEYNNTDLLITMKQVVMFLDLYTDPYKAMNYCAGQCNYGGRVTDDKDRRCLLTILEAYFTPDILEDGFKLTPSGVYKMPNDGSYDHYIQHIESLPLDTTPDVFGFHSNARITKDTKTTTSLFASVLLTQAGKGGGESEDAEESGGGNSKENVITEVANSHLKKIPTVFDMEIAALKYPIKWEESMNTVLVQELARFNNLSTVISKSLGAIKDAVKGIIVLSSQLEKLGDSLFFGHIPELWLASSYPSLKSLAGYMEDLLERLEFMQQWLDTKAPSVFWISGFYFTSAFLTGTKQNFARSHSFPIDNVAFDFTFMPQSDYTISPENGVYIRGLFFDGARWNHEAAKLDDPIPKVLFSPAPIIWVEPKDRTKLSEYNCYDCPVYRTSERWGILATTGHSTNFVLMIRVPSDRDGRIWIRAGIALLCALD